MIEPFGTLDDGTQVDVISIGTDALSVKILTLGAIINDVRLIGVDWPLTLGSTGVAGYRGPLQSFGSFMGPVINRIKGCQATIDGQTYTFERHESGNLTQHSGSTGFQNQVWTVADRSPSSVTLTLDVPDGLGGFPGNRVITVIYTVDGAALRMTATATTDAPTLMNPANHSYWCLDPQMGFAGQTFTVHADHYTEPADDLTPTGTVLPVEGSPYDFRGGMVLAGDETQFFDLNLVTANARGPLRPVATLRGTAGVEMIMSTTECGLQVYDCGTIKAPDFPSHHGPAIMPFSGLALEAQAWPGAVAHAHFPSYVLRPDEVYEQVTEWSFSQSAPA